MKKFSHEQTRNFTKKARKGLFIVRMKLIPVGILIILILGSQSSAQPNLPFYDFGAGPCEFCLYGEWTAIKDSNIYQKRSKNSKVAFKVKVNEKLTAVTGVVITTKTGVGIALENTILNKYNKKNDSYSDIKIYRNERFYLLTYHGEGVYTVWFKGKILEAHFVDWKLKQISHPEFIWWVKIKNSKGQIGWTKMTRNFTGPHEV